jgi:hypothetical protein
MFGILKHAMARPPGAGDPAPGESGGLGRDLACLEDDTDQKIPHEASKHRPAPAAHEDADVCAKPVRAPEAEGAAGVEIADRLPLDILPERGAWRYGTLLDTPPDVEDPDSVGAWIPGLNRWVSWLRPADLGIASLSALPDPEPGPARIYGVRNARRLVTVVTDATGTPLTAVAARPQREAGTWLPDRALRTVMARYGIEFAQPDLVGILWGMGWQRELFPPRKTAKDATGAAAGPDR